MPRRPLKPCRYPGCPALVDKGGYCEQHRQLESRRYEDGRKDTKERRFYNSAQWQKVRELKRRHDPLCEQCKREGKVVLADLVHHKAEVRQDWDKRLNLDCLESLCTSCHEKIHQRFGKV